MSLKAVFTFIDALLSGYFLWFHRASLIYSGMTYMNKTQTTVCTGKQKTLKLQVPRHWRFNSDCSFCS